VAQSYFSASYAAARERFRGAAKARGARLDALMLAALGPVGEALSIDIAWLGAPRPRRVMVHVSGTHGVEGFAGSAVQLEFLDRCVALPRDCAVALIHALNPYGMAWLRRANEDNVDPNRNFLAPGESFSGAPPLYAALDPLLNPASPPGFDLFLPRALAWIARHGRAALTQAIAGGQYEYPRGLFFGGRQHSEGTLLYTQWLDEHCTGVEYLLAIDAHTGLGRRGVQTLVVETEPAGEPSLCGTLRSMNSGPVIPPNTLAARDYVVHGGHAGLLARTLRDVRVGFVTAEIGTLAPLALLHALREENRWHQYGAATPAHPSKEKLLEAFCPRKAAWRKAALAHGRALIDEAVRIVCAASAPR